MMNASRALGAMLLLILATGARAAAPKDEGGWDALTAAMNKKDYALAGKLVKAKPELAKKKNERGWSALHVAAKQGQVELDARLGLITALLDAGADVNLKIDKDPDNLWMGKTPLHFAASGDAYEVARLLVTRGADAAAEDAMGNTALHSAAFYGNKPLAELLLSKGARIDKKGPFGRAPLHEAVSQNQYNLALFLLQKGADVNVREAQQVAPLHLAAHLDSTSIARLLLDRKADVNARDSSGMTPLTWADPPPDPDSEEEIVYGPPKVNPEMVELLKRYGGTK